MKYVAQEGDQDCGVAVLAMLTDRTLSEAIDWLGWDGHPLKPHEMHRWLWDGTLLDPWDRTRVSMLDAYHAVSEVVGVMGPGPAR